MIILKLKNWPAMQCLELLNHMWTEVLDYLHRQDTIAKEYVQKLVIRVNLLKISDPLEEGCRLGPIVSENLISIFAVALRKFCKKKLLDASPDPSDEEQLQQDFMRQILVFFCYVALLLKLCPSGEGIGYVVAQVDPFAPNELRHSPSAAWKSSSISIGVFLVYILWFPFQILLHHVLFWLVYAYATTQKLI